MALNCTLKNGLNAYPPQKKKTEQEFLSQWIKRKKKITLNLI